MGEIFLGENKPNLQFIIMNRHLAPEVK